MLQIPLDRQFEFCSFAVICSPTFFSLSYDKIFCSFLPRKWHSFLKCRTNLAEMKEKKISQSAEVRRQRTTMIINMPKMIYGFGRRLNGYAFLVLIKSQLKHHQDTKGFTQSDWILYVLFDFVFSVVILLLYCEYKLTIVIFLCFAPIDS